MQTCLVILLSIYILLVPSLGHEAAMTVEGRVFLGKLDPSNVKLSLNGALMESLTSADGKFRFYDVPSGIYLLDVMDTRFVFSTFKLKVTAEEEEVSVVEYKYPGAKRISSDYPVMITPHIRMSFFQKREGVSIWGMIMGNPTMLMAGFMVLVIVVLPKMMNNMDPEQLEEMKKQSILNQGGIDPSDPTKALRELWGGGKKDDDDDE